VPVKLSETPGAVRTPPVDFGESTADILRELGYSETEIKQFEKDGVV
jgi:crotonobetainyl-CoA:carnitine CoA-transferase CaiB-like acyl-CoA transferase